MAWHDFMKIWSYAFTQDPLAKKIDKRSLTGAGTMQADAIPDLRNADVFSATGGGFIRLRETNDFIDLSTTTNRQARYKEYFRLLQGVAEIEMAMTVFADEACVAGSTEIATLFHGYVTIDWLVKNKTEERFPVYCFDSEKQDYTIGWAYSPRLVKREKTVHLYLDNGEVETVTADHRIMMRDGTFAEAGSLQAGDELMPFYRYKAKESLNNLKTNQFPRIYTHNKGWIHERQFVDEWRTGKSMPQYERLNKVARMITAGLNYDKMKKATGHDPITIRDTLTRGGFSHKELVYLGKKPDRRRVLAVIPGKEIDVYDLSVEHHQNFCTRSLVMHNCQRDENGRVFKITCENKEVAEELEFMYFHRNMLNMDQRFVWNLAKKTFVNGDWFGELIINPDNPKEGIYSLRELPAESMYRIETTKSKLVEFQQGKEGPDFQALQRAPITQATDEELRMATAVRFAPESILHIRIGDDRKTFYPYGVSLIEPARGPAHQLRMMEDAMVVYRLCVTSYVKIATIDGSKYMKDICPGDRVWTLGRDMKLVSSLVTHHINNGTKPVLKVASNHGELKCTYTHPILVRNKITGVVEYVDAENIRIDTHQFVRPRINAAIPKKINRIYTGPYARLARQQINKHKVAKIKLEACMAGFSSSKKQALNKGWGFLSGRDGTSLPLPVAIKVCESFGLDHKKLICHNKMERLPERINLSEYVDEDFAKLLGFLMGDGTISLLKRCAKVIFAGGEIPFINQKYQKLMERYFGRCIFNQDKRKKRGIGNYVVNSRTACVILEDLGVGGDCYNKRIPGWLFSERPEIRRAFLEGITDAEGEKRGMACKTWNTTVRLCNKHLVEDIQQLWRSLGLHASETKNIKEPSRFIEGKQIAADGESWQVYLSETEVPFYDDITSVEACGEEEVFDLTVDNEEHNFLAENCCVHNTRAPERRVFYIDIGQLPPFKAEAFMERLKDQFRKKKVVTARGGQGASAVDERWHPPAQDEDYWVPIKPNSTTRIDTLPGAENLGEIDDVVFFRNKLFTALNFPKSYFSTEDPNATRITLSAQDVKFARLIERLQSYIEDGLWEIADRHLKLRGFPEESYEDLKVKMTPPSDWRELSRAEVVTNRINNANGLKGSQLMSDFDVLTKWMNYTEDEANEMIARMKIQKLEDLKLQVLAQNPQLLGVGIPGQAGQQEMGAQPGGPNPMLGPEGMPGAAPPMGAPPGGAPPMGAPPAPGGPPMPPPDAPGAQAPGMLPPAEQAFELPEPEESDIIKYDLELQDYEREQDNENIDFSEAE